MAFSVEMPALGESVTEGTVTRWLKQEGDTVEADEPLLEVSTDKVDTEIPAPTSGVLVKIIAKEDDVVEVGGELALIGDEDESADSSGSGDESDSEDEPEDESESESQDEAEPEDESEAEPEPESESEDEAASKDEDTEDTEDTEKKPAESGDKKSASSGSGTPVKMPELGESVTEGTVTRWLKAIGDEVAADEPLLEVSTDKVDTEIPSPVAGTLLEITAQEDDTVEVGGQLAVIGSGTPAEEEEKDESETEPEPEAEPEDEAEKKPEPEEEPEAEEKPEPEEDESEADQKAEKKAEPEEKPEPQEKPEPEPQEKADEKSEPKAEEKLKSETGDSAPYVTPLVRKLAAEHDIDLGSIKGTGVGGRIRKQDVLEAAEARKKPAEEPSAPAASTEPKKLAGVRPELAELRGTTQKANRIRQITAIRTRESLQTTAQLTQTHEVDLTRIAKLRATHKEAFKEKHGVNLTFMPFFAKAAVEALQLHPNVNASYDEDAKQITYHGEEHLGIAVDTPNGLLSPVIHKAGEMNLAQLANAIADIAKRARSGGLKPDELSGGTFTVTNIGSNGALFDTPILVTPQSAMLGTGAIVKRPVVISDSEGNDVIAIRSMAFLPLTYDHRLVDGADAGRFLSTIKQRLEEGDFEGDLDL